MVLPCQRLFLERSFQSAFAPPLGALYCEGKPIADPHEAFNRPTLADQPNACLIEVGANEGSFVIEIANRHPSLQMYALEPTPQLYEQIAKIVKRHQAYRLPVHRRSR